MEKLPDLHSSNWPHFPKESNSNRCEEAKKNRSTVLKRKKKNKLFYKKYFVIKIVKTFGNFLF